MKNLPWKTVAMMIVAGALGISLSLLIGPKAERKGPEQDAGSSRGPKRIICMSPSVTEWTFALGAGNRVVGVSHHTVFPLEAQDLPRCGGFVNPNFERIAQLQPDLIVTQGLAKKVQSFARAKDIPCITLNLADLEAIYSALDRLGDVFGCPGRAQALKQRIKNRLRAIHTRVQSRPRVETFVVIGRAPGSLQNLTTIGPDTFLADILRIAGGKNVFSDLSEDYRTINKEILAERRPEAILELRGKGMMGPAKRERIRRTWSQMSVLPAVKRDRIHVISKDYALIPGSRITELARAIAKKLHPPENTK